MKNTCGRVRRNPDSPAHRGGLRGFTGAGVGKNASMGRASPHPPRVVDGSVRACVRVRIDGHGARRAGQEGDPRRLPVAETGFDPAMNNLYSAGIVRAVFDTLYTYDYLARPAKLVPNVTAAMPEVSDEGRVYTVKLRPGVYFQPDPVFGGSRARAHRGRRGLFVQARARSEAPFAVELSHRGQVRRHERGRGRCEPNRQVQLTARCRGSKWSTATPCAFAWTKKHRLQPALRAVARGAVDRRPRGQSRNTASPTAARWAIP